MEYTINGMITLSPISKSRLSSAVDFISPSKANVVLNSESDDKLSVLIKLEADSDTEAQELAQLELSRICNLLSFFHNIAVSKSRVTGMSYTRTTSKGHTDVAGLVTLRLKATANAEVILGKTHLAILTSNLEQDYSADFEDVISIWGHAISRESSTERFFSLYRLMEYLFFGNTKNLEEWIKQKDPLVQLFPCTKFRPEHTVYTYLRDNIHPKEGKKFLPIKEIENNLSKFQTLVQQKIKEKFGLQ